MSVTISGSGQIIKQVVSTLSSTQVSSTATTFTNTGIGLSITPTNSANRIFISISTIGGSAGNQPAFTIMRDGGTPAGFPQFLPQADANWSTSSFEITLQYLDAPATTSAVTYSVGYCIPGGGTVYLNRNGGVATGTTTITLMEVAYA